MPATPPPAPQNPPDPPPEPATGLDPGTLADAVATIGPPPTGTGSDTPARAWATVSLVLLVLGSAAAMLLTGHEVTEALLLAGGVTLLGVAIARRILADGALLPTVAIAGAVTAFAVVLLISGHEISEVAVIAGGAGLVAGEVTGWALRPTTTRRGV